MPSLAFVATASVVVPDGAGEAAALEELEALAALVAAVERELDVADAGEFEEESSLHAAMTSSTLTTTNETTFERFTLSLTAATAEEIAGNVAG